MLAVKKTNSKKLASYAIILLVLFGVTFYMVYVNFLAGPKTTVVLENVDADIFSNPEDLANLLDDTQTSQDNSNNKVYNTDELNFLNSNKFKNLKSFNENIVIDAGRSKNPFEF